jgi:hypothetical protein
MNKNILYLRLSKDRWALMNALTEATGYSVAQIGIEALDIGMASLRQRLSLPACSQTDTLELTNRPV